MISKGANKLPRVISIPTFRDRITLRALCNLLRSCYAEQVDTKLPQHIIAELQTALASGDYESFVKIDVSNFYPSIDHKTLRRMLRGKIRKPEIRKLIDAAITTPTVPFPDRDKDSSRQGVPQGLAVSNILAEIYLTKLDQWARTRAGVSYFRYVDDILLLTNEDPEHIFEEFRAVLSDDFKLEAHPLGESGKSKVGFVNEGFNFLGYSFNDGKAAIKRDSILRLEASLAKILTTYKYKCASTNPHWNAFERRFYLAQARKICLWRLNLRITGCVFDNVRRGWMFYFSQIDSSSLRQIHHLDKTLQVLARRFSVELNPGEIKSFVRTYHETQRSNLSHRYIPNFDTTSVGRNVKFLSYTV